MIVTSQISVSARWPTCLAATFFVMLFACHATAQSPASAPPPAPPPGCTSAESRQLDFWVGHWSVSPKAVPSRKAATSLIEKLYSGCAIRENWMPFQGGPGGSFSAYLPGRKVWQQLWVDSSGSWVTFTGGWDGNAMILEGVWPVPGHPQQRTRMSYRPLSDGTVEQSGVTSDDEGKTWQPGFDLIYTRIP
ncbi:MAG: hypothetical protein WCB58_01890 [Acidobacteriaceae bacterium]